MCRVLQLAVLLITVSLFSACVVPGDYSGGSTVYVPTPVVIPRTVYVPTYVPGTVYVPQYVPPPVYVPRYYSRYTPPGGVYKPPAYNPYRGLRVR